MKNIWLDGIMGLVIGDALGCPVQFLSREAIERRGSVTGMEGYGTFHMPVGTWTDDSSMTLATLDSILDKNKIDPNSIMKNFVKWKFEGAYTPFGQAFDEGITCTNAIHRFVKKGDWKTCGATGEYANGNGALMRILPICLYYIDQQNIGLDEEAIRGIHAAGSLTHNHIRSNMACGFYYFMAKEIVNHRDMELQACLQKGIEKGIQYYSSDKECLSELEHFQRIFHLSTFAKVPEEKIKSSGYVIDSIEAAVWCLITTDSFQECVLKAVNLGDDSDTVAAIAGGLAGLFYGYEAIPNQWLSVLQKREYVENMCRRVAICIRSK